LDERRSYWPWGVSGALHAALLALILLGFASVPRFEDSEEAVPIETVSVSEMNQVMEGEKTAKPEAPQKPAHTYDPSAIAKLIQPKTQANAAPNATGSATPQGLPHHDAQKMSLSMASALDAWLTESYLSCWTPPPAMPEGDVYVAQIKVVFNPDGSLSARPVLLNPPGDPSWRAHAESAMRAVRKCDPLHVPPQYAPFFDQWKVETIHFDPRETQG
jgi:colicin import membrane protein